MQSARDTLIHPDTARPGQRVSVCIPLSLALLVGLGGISLSPAAAQTPAQKPADISPDAIKQREQELEATRAQQKSAAELQQKLKADIAAIGQDRSKLNAQLIDIAGQVRGVETRIADAEARLRPLDGREAQIKSSLESGRAAARRTAHPAGPAGTARRRTAIAAHRDAARSGGAGIARPR
jgi:septal ring factor EnvC (AmiA/AmiB activator)